MAGNSASRTKKVTPPAIAVIAVVGDALVEPRQESRASRTRALRAPARVLSGDGIEPATGDKAGRQRRDHGGGPERLSVRERTHCASARSIDGASPGVDQPDGVAGERIRSPSKDGVRSVSAIAGSGRHPGDAAERQLREEAPAQLTGN